MRKAPTLNGLSEIVSFLQCPTEEDAPFKNMFQLFTQQTYLKNKNNINLSKKFFSPVTAFMWPK